MNAIRVWPGNAYPLGASWDGEGVNFALFSQSATAVELCLFAPDGKHETARVVLSERDQRVFHAYLPDVRPGQLYGYRVSGPYQPERGQRFNPNKLLIDPYARAISGRIEWNDALFGYQVGNPDADLSFCQLDSAPYVPKSVVIDSAFTWGDDRPPQIPWTRSVIYECHVKAMTARHPDVPEALRGTYLGLCSDAILDHLLSLGVTAVELLPVHHVVHDRRLVELGLSNYWGYNSVGFFAPDPRYASAALGQQVTEFKTMVKAFHRVGIEVLLDVVYNHTGEGNELGPTLCFRGIDNEAYYQLSPEQKRHYLDYTGCGNSFNTLHPRGLQLCLDSLRYWVLEMHVDGFRFDLAPALAREPIEFNGFGRFFSTIQQDPILSRVKLIAEPWDLGPNGYQLGAFPPGWAEWNGRYRDALRRFWRGDEGQVPELGSRLSGSSDVFQGSDRGPYASVNFVTCHDGFTLSDLVSYDHKHNQANGEDNRDGADDNLSHNWGAEGATEELSILRLREQLKKNFLATLAFSQGVPMLSHGDELGRSQRGNNNAYCQDSELSWVDWKLDENAKRLLEFTRMVFQIRSGNPVFRRRGYFDGGRLGDGGPQDVHWLRADGQEMTRDDWENTKSRMLGMLVHGGASDEVDERGRPNRGETLLLILNAANRARQFRFPDLREPGLWFEMVNTAQHTQRLCKGQGISLAPHSLILLKYNTGDVPL